VYSDRGITRAFYDSLLVAFLISLEKKIGRRWTAEIREAWIFTFASVHMHLIGQLQLTRLLSEK
jgi:hypothetical protein